MAVITISRKYASGGRKLGKLLSKNLNYAYVDKSHFQLVAERFHAKGKNWQPAEEHSGHTVSDIFFKFFSGLHIERIAAYDKTLVKDQQYQESLRDLLLAVAEKDNVVIVGRAAHFFLQDVPDCLHVRLAASFEWRRNYAHHTLGILPSRVARILEAKDRNHEWFLRTICGKKFGEPQLFHLTLSMDLIDLEKAAAFLAISIQYLLDSNTSGGMQPCQVTKAVKAAEDLK
ncbi:MAG: cytidylate kinase-like family protein [Deltaproteobacteria bacterium]|nr:cytidylate kinase-like family protein [Deltaproteobacteria bacterium]MBW2071202.1 cytidylate kinase-like family protein [Deltaproteobacteria bacterium]